MTFPNRRNYTPGEKKRVRKYAAVDQKLPPAAPLRGNAASMDAAPMALTPNPIASRTRGASGKQRAKRTYGGEPKRMRDALESPLQAELIAELAVFSPLHDTPASSSFASFQGAGYKKPAHQLHHHPQQQHAAHASLAPLLVSKQQLQQKAEDARQRLLDDELFQQQQNARSNRLLVFSNVVFANKAQQQQQDALAHGNDCGAEGFDPFRAAMHELPALDLEGSLSDSDSLQSVLVDLQSIGASSLQELEHPLAMIDDALIRESYQEAVGTLQEWNTRHLQLKMQQQLFHSFAGPGGGVPPSSPSDVLLAASDRQQAKKRTNLSKTAKTVLKTWFDNHLHHPYPTEEEKDMLGLNGGITIEQVNNWFINTRGRKWKPMLTRLMKEKAAGECELYDRMVERIEEPYRRAPTNW